MGHGRINDDTLAQLRTSNPRGVKLLEVVAEDSLEGSPSDDFVFRKIDRAAFTAFKASQKRSMTHGGGGDEATLLARSLLLWPAAEEFDALRERAPSVSEELGGYLLADANGGLEVREGKR